MVQQVYQATIHNPLVTGVATLPDLGKTEEIIETSAKRVFFIELDARSAGGQETHLRIGVGASWVNGTDAAHFVWQLITDKKRTLVFPFGIPFDKLAAACNVEAGGGPDTPTSPTGTINIKIGYGAV